MKFETGTYQVEIINESNYNPDSEDNISEYEKKYLTESEYNLPTKFGIKVLENGDEINNVIIGAEGGASGLHETSQIIENNQILICCSDTVFCLDLPTLNLNWKTKTDEFTSFEIFKINNGYIIHGELEITRIDQNGKIVWKNGGADIFVTPEGKDDFEVNDDYIKATDWENRIYKWDFNGTELI
jgi:outer membrane protein assembly factor BamB